MGGRRSLGMLCCVAGGLLVSFAGTRYTMGAAAQERARSVWDAREAHAAVLAANAAALAYHAPPPVTGSPVARLLIPKIGLDEIVLEGVDDDVMNGGPGHLPGSPLPGLPGNSVISAHRDRHFRHFDALAVGDTVVTEAGGRQARWVIVSRRIVDKDAPALFPTHDVTLTLTTCWPIRYFGSAPNRLIVTAKPVSSLS